MIFNSHYLQQGQHAFLSPSKYHWINYDDEKLERMFLASMAAKRGTDLHDLANNLIRLGVKLPRAQQTLNMYVNDAIGFQMKPEQTLWYSEDVFGTADAISFKRNKLKIADLKTGVIVASEHQLEVYAALFCLEYRHKPMSIEIELRIYQSDEVRIFKADPDVITHIMDRIITLDKRIKELREELE